MGDKITDLPQEPGVPPLPPRTYQWEDIRRQKLEGRYPWTYLHKAPFDNENWEKTKEHEYEPVIPMDARKTPPPFVTITVEHQTSTTTTTSATVESIEPPQDKNHLSVPEQNEYDNEDDSSDASDDVSEEITAEELQHRLEERYFRQSPGSSKHEYELTETRSVSPAFASDDSAGGGGGGGGTSKTPDTPRLQRKMQLQADRIRQKFKTFREQMSRGESGGGAKSPPPAKRKTDEGVGPKAKKSSPKKNKFNFRRHDAKSPSSERSKFHLPTPSNFHMPQAKNLSFRSLPSFSRSRSSSVKERDRARSPSSEADSPRKKFEFNFGTYPRSIFTRKKKADEKEETLSTAKPKSAPSSPAHPRRSPFPHRWISKLTEHRREEEDKKTTERVKAKAKAKEKDENVVVKESIFISLHEDKKRTEVVAEASTESDEVRPAPPKVDNKDFIFISLHEERFPEKLRKPEEQQFTEEEKEIEAEVKKAATARKFHGLLKRLETDRKWRSRRAAAEQDDKPEPVEITEITTDDENDNAGASAHENKVETPEEEDERSGISAENVPPEKFVFEKKGEKADEFIVTGVTTAVYKSAGKEELLDSSTREGRRPRVNGQDGQSAEEVHGVLQAAEFQEEATLSSKPRKIPRKKLRKPTTTTTTTGSEKESKESLSAFEEDTSLFDDVLALDEQKPMTKTYIKASLEEIFEPVDEPEPKNTERQFAEYEKALETGRRYSCVDNERECYTSQNTLARLETPMPPSRPSRGKTLTRNKRGNTVDRQNKENVYDPEAAAAANPTFNTFPLARPDKPRRTKCRKRRTYSNSTNATDNADVKNMDELEDEAISKNIVNSKQLSISFLPLTSNVVGEPITEYNLRETSSMIHLSVKDPPLPPKRKKGQRRADTGFKYNSLPNQRFSSKRSVTPSEAFNHLGIHAHDDDDDLEYADDVHSTVHDSDTPPRRPSRKRSAVPSVLDEDRTSREIESLPSERSFKDDNDFGDSDSKDVHGYAVIGGPQPPRSDSKTTDRDSQQSTARRKSRRLSDFFTLPRIRGPPNYIASVSQTLNPRRLPSPTRPPRRPRSPRQPMYTNDDDDDDDGERGRATHRINFEEEEQLNFALATEDDDVDDREDAKDLQAEDVLEKMKGRPLPAPPRPIRKPKEPEPANAKCDDYSLCVKSKKRSQAKTDTLDRRIIVEEQIASTETIEHTFQVQSKNAFTNGCSDFNTRSEQNQCSLFAKWETVERDGERESSGHESTFQRSHCNGCTEPKPESEISGSSPSRDNWFFRSTPAPHKPPDTSGILKASPPPDEPSRTNGIASSSNTPPDTWGRGSPCRPDDLPSVCGFLRSSPPLNQSIEILATNLPKSDRISMTGQCAEVAPMSPKSNEELDVVSEIQSSKVLGSCSAPVSSTHGDVGGLAFDSSNFFARISPARATSQKSRDERDGTPSSDDVPPVADPTSHFARSRISSMIPEVGSDEESNSTAAAAAKVVRPSRRKQTPKKEESAASSDDLPRSNSASLADLMCQILQICHSSVGQAVHSLLEQIIPEDREKRNEVQTAIWVITLIVAGCLMLGLQSNEKVVHHHHWDFHFPPPH